MDSNETPNLDKYLCYKSQMGVANIGTDSLHVHVYLNDPMTKVFLK